MSISSLLSDFRQAAKITWSVVAVTGVIVMHPWTNNASAPAQSAAVANTASTDAPIIVTIRRARNLVAPVIDKAKALADSAREEIASTFQPAATEPNPQKKGEAAPQAQTANEPRPDLDSCRLSFPTYDDAAMEATCKPGNIKWIEQNRQRMHGLMEAAARHVGFDYIFMAQAYSDEGQNGTRIRPRMVPVDPKEPNGAKKPVTSALRGFQILLGTYVEKLNDIRASKKDIAFLNRPDRAPTIARALQHHFSNEDILKLAATLPAEGEALDTLEAAKYIGSSIHKMHQDYPKRAATGGLVRISYVFGYDGLSSILDANPKRTIDQILGRDDLADNGFSPERSARLTAENFIKMYDDQTARVEEWDKAVTRNDGKLILQADGSVLLPPSFLSHIDKYMSPLKPLIAEHAPAGKMIAASNAAKAPPPKPAANVQAPASPTQAHMADSFITLALK